MISATRFFPFVNTEIQNNLQPICVANRKPLALLLTNEAKKSKIVEYF